MPGQAQISYAWDDADRLLTITQGSNVITFDYDNANRRTKLMTYPSGTSTEYAYDNASRLTGLTYKHGGNTLGALTYAYDVTSQRTQVGGSWARTGLPAAVASATYNMGNHQTAFGGGTLTYDLNGNLTGDGTNSYTWNARNQLASLTGPVAGSFVYDAFGRRQRKTIDGTITDFVYDGLNPVRQAVGASTVDLLTGLGIDEYLMRTDSSSSRDLLTDPLGSTVSLSDSSGTIQTEYSYEPFGTATASGSTSANELRYTGREDDGTGGTGLNYYRARYYHPTLQRFISEDPLGPLGGWNHYEYVGNNPLKFVDPRGLTRLEFDLGRGTLTIDPERPGEGPYVIPATSGVEQCMNQTKCEAMRSRGPIPRGEYFVTASEIDQPSALWALGRSVVADWGSFRVPIHPEPGTLMPGRDPATFKLHGGRRPGSAGCIDVGGGIFGDSVTERLLKDLRADPDGRVPLRVK